MRLAKCPKCKSSRMKEFEFIEGCRCQNCGYEKVKFPVKFKIPAKKETLPFIEGDKCVNDGRHICNLGYACDECPFYKNELFVVNEDGEELKVKVLPNNTFCDEFCCACGTVFDACRNYIYQLVGFEDYSKHYVCYDCVELTKK